MWSWRRKKKPPETASSVEERLRRKYTSFRELLSLNNECLEIMAGLQEDLQFAPPLLDVLAARVAAIFEKAAGAVAALARLTGIPQEILAAALNSQHHEVERYTAALQELSAPRLAAWLGEVTADSVDEVGGKAALLGEIRGRLGIPVPNGYVLTTEAYRQFCGLPLWKPIRDAVRDLDPNDLDAFHRIAAELTAMAMACPVPRAVEVAITERAAMLFKTSPGLAVRSSAVGEGGSRTYAGQFMSLLNVPPGELVEAYKRVVAGRFSERALFYRISTGLLEVDSPMAVLFLPVLRARAAGMMYTRDPNDPKSKALWITATRGLGLEIASGRMPADLFLVSRERPHDVLERSIARKETEIVLESGGGVTQRPLAPADSAEPSLAEEQLRLLAGWGVRIEEHFKTPQDIEWVLDEDGRLWIVQARPLALSGAAPARAKTRPKGDPILDGGRTVYPGMASGHAFLLEDVQNLSSVPEACILFIRRPSPEMVGVFPRIAGLVAEWGNVAGHAAALLREFRVPSVFQTEGAFAKLASGDAVSLDAVQARVYPGLLWPVRKTGHALIGERARQRHDPISQRLLALNLTDPAASNFRPSGCKSAHDVLRYCHEKAIETMFAVGDIVLEQELHRTKELDTEVPLKVSVLDLGGGLAMAEPGRPKVTPAEVVSRPFHGLWRGLTHPEVSWTREFPANLSDLASVLARSFTPQGDAMRPLGDVSYLLVASEYMNLNSRLAYHFSLVDACVSDTPSENYITFRFEGGGTSRERRSLRACFIEACLGHYGYQADRRGDLVNAWFRKALPEVMEEKLDILGRLLASSSQLDMFMTSRDVMHWYVRQFIEGNYSFRRPRA